MIGWHVESELLAYLDGELDARERAQVEPHLAGCARCRDKLARMQTLRAELSTTLDAALDPIHLPATADKRIRERLRHRVERRPHWWTLWQRRGLLAQALLALLVVAFVGATYQTAHLAERIDLQETVVLGQDKLAPGSHAALRVLVRSVNDSEPVQGAQVVVRVGRTPGLASILYQGVTDAQGTAGVEFTVPAELEGEAQIVVETRSELGEDRVVRPVTIVRVYKLFVTSDKPIYQPGQTVHIRALALGAVDLRPAAGQEIEFLVVDPDGDRLVRRTLPASDFGIAALDFPLSPHITHGRYTIQATLGNTISERTVTVEPYILPKFRVTVETNRSFYWPGARVEGCVQARYFFGKPVADGQVTLRGYTYEVERAQVVELQGTTDEQGGFEFSFDLPAFFVGGASEEGLAEFGLEVEVVDQADHREATSHTLPVAEQLILIDAVPESGVLKPGVENVVFILTSYPDGRPAETDLTVTADGETHELSTGPYGLAEFRYVPYGAGTELIIEARDASGAEARETVWLEADRAPETVLLRAERAAYEVGDTIRLEALTTAAGGAIYLDVVREGQTVSTRSAPVEEGRALFAVDLDETMFGTLELHAYKVLGDGTIARDTRLVVVDQPRQVAIAVAADAETYRPGDTATLEFDTRTDAGPVQSALGLAIVDESVFALEEQAPGFARLYFLLERELLEPRYEVHGFHVPTLLDAEAQAQVRQRQDAAARASWAGSPFTDFTLIVRSYADKLAQLLERQATAFIGLGEWLGRALVVLPLLLTIVVVWGLQPTGVLGRAVARVAGGFFVFLFVSPLVAGVVGLVMWALWAALDVAAFALTLLLWVGLLGGLVFYGWRGRDVRAQLVAGLLATYLVLGGLTVYVAERGGDSRGPRLALILAGFLLALFGLTVLGQGLVLEGRRGPGWLTTALALLLVPLVIYLALVPGLTSGLVHTLGDPLAYAFPAGLLSGCAPAATPTPEPGYQFSRLGVTAPAEAPPPADGERAEGEAAPAERPRLRQYFPETMYWNPEALTDEGGHLTLEIPLADSITTWRLTALASTQRGELGATTYPIRVFQDFFVDLDLPVALTQGDEVSVPLAVYNYLPEAQEVRLELEPADWYTPLPDQSTNLPVYQSTMTIASNDIEVVYFRIRADRFGRFPLQVTAWGEHMSDAVAREVTVLPDGTELRTSTSDWLRGGGATAPAVIPASAISGTTRIEVKLYPGASAQLVEGLEGLLRMPSGCFEQTSSATYPNLLVLDYLVRSGQATLELQLTAERYVATGYQRLLTFEVAGEPGGFSLFGDAPPSLMHTAYGLMEFSDMARVYPVDPALIERTASWLLAQQEADGSWDPGALGYSHFESWQNLANARLPMTAYVAWALVEAGYGDTAGVQQALYYLLEHADEADDPYVLALAANCFAASNPLTEFRSAAETFTAQLEEAAIVEDDAAHWVSQVESFSGARGESAGLETTALATYALMRAGGDPELITQGLTYLVRAKDTFGTWQTTQATVLALKAFVLSLETAGEAPVDATVLVSLNGGATRQVTLTSEEAGVVYTVYFDHVPVGNNQVELQVYGDQTRGLLYQVTTVYYVPWEEAPVSAEPIDIRVTYDPTTLAVDEMVTAHVEIALNPSTSSGHRQPGSAQWVIVDLGVPPGFEVVTEDLEQIVAQSAGYETRVKRYELTGRQIILYLENLSTSISFDYRLRARFPLRAQSPAASVYDYYNPTLRDTQPPTLIMVTDTIGRLVN